MGLVKRLFGKKEKVAVLKEQQDIDIFTQKATISRLSFKNLVKNRTLVASITGYGKSHTIRKVVEAITGMIPMVIFDLEGEYTDLKGFEVIAEGSDPAKLAKKVLDSHLSVVLDLSDTDDKDMQEFVAGFCEEFLSLETKKKISYLMVFDEADEFVPEKGFAKSGCLEAIIKVVKKGRKRGIGMIFATQRLSYLSKNVISQCVNIIIGRTEWKNDIDVLKRYLGIENDEASDLKKLKPGEFFFRGPFVADKDFAQVKK